MAIFNSFNVFLKMFVFFGIAPFMRDENSRNTESSKMKDMFKSVLYLLPAVFVSVIGVSVFLVRLTIGFSNYGQIEFLLLNLFQMSVTATILSATAQTVIYKSEYFDLLNHLEKMNNLFALKISKDLNFYPVIKRFRIKFFVTTFSVTIMFVFVIIAAIEEGQTVGHVVLLRLQQVVEIITAIICLHPIFYIDFVRMYIRELSSALVYDNDKSNFQSFAILDSTIKLNDIRFIHFELWKIVQLINTCFGWNLLIMLVKFFIDNVSNTYWIYMIYQTTSFDALIFIEMVNYTLYSFGTLSMLINSCHNCSSEITNLKKSINTSCFSLNGRLDNKHQCKHELLEQIRNFPVEIVAGGFLCVDRNHMAAIVTAVCSYMIIFIQFYLASENQLGPPHSTNTDK